jgi:wobble nucleotide-excising tRNase
MDPDKIEQIRNSLFSFSNETQEINNTYSKITNFNSYLLLILEKKVGYT